MPQNSMTSFMDDPQDGWGGWGRQTGWAGEADRMCGGGIQRGWVGEVCRQDWWGRQTGCAGEAYREDGWGRYADRIGGGGVGGGNRWSGASHRSVPAPGGLSVRPDRCSMILVRTPVLCTSYESKPIKYQVIIVATRMGSIPCQERCLEILWNFSDCCQPVETLSSGVNNV